MSKHEHRIFQSGATVDPIVPVCSECGKDLMTLYLEQEQQLAEARAKIARQEEELRILAAQRQDKQAELTEARALLDKARWHLQLTTQMLSRHDLLPDEENMVRKDNPTLLEQIRAFLAKQSG